MLSNYLTVLFRSVRQRKLLSAINVLSLTIGLAFALLIGVFVVGELEVNKSLKDVDDLYLVQNTVEGQSSTIEFFTPPILCKKVNEEYSDKIVDYYRFWDRNITVSKHDKHFRLQSMIGDPSFLRMFGFTVLHGTDKDALSRPNTIVITEEVARKFFNRTDVVNETLAVSTEQHGIKEYVITAVIAEPDKKNTVSDLMNMNAQLFISLENRADFFDDLSLDSWQSGIIAYIRVAPGVAKNEVESLLNKVLQKDAPKEVSEKRSIHIAPLSEYYLLTNHGAVKKMITSLSFIVVFILLLAITNFINISMARSFSRLKEVGVRKVIGGVRRQLIVQFMLESISFTVLSVILSLFIYQVLRGVFSTVLDTNLPSVLAFKIEWWFIIVFAVFFIGILAGLYPAAFQSGLRPIDSLKGKAHSAQGTFSLSRILMITQFAITIFIFISAIVFSRQVNFMLERDLGYNKSHVLIVYSVPRWWNSAGFEKMEAVRNIFLQSSKVRSVSLSWGAPGWGIGGIDNSVYNAQGDPDNGVKVHITGVDEHFDEVFELQLLEGSFFSEKEAQWKPQHVVINEAARNALKVRVGDEVKADENDSVSFVIAGVVKDFNYESMHEPIKPVLLMHNRDYEGFRYFSFKLEPSNPAASVAEVERLWTTAFPDQAFSYTFADEKLQALYTTEIQMKKASTVATALMALIVVTGVLGLLSLSVARRTKEIGIRKVLGASVQNVLTLFSREYLALIVFSSLIAIPLAYLFVDAWLENFVYHIALSAWMFALPSTFLLGCVVLIVVAQTYGTAAMNPVKSIRYE